MPDTASDTPASILLIDDHPLLRQGIKQLVEMESDIIVAGEASNATDGIRLATELEPDLILMDLNMPEINGIEALKKLRELNISSRIIMFTVSDQEDDVVSALRAGADGYLLKDMEPEDMIAQLRQAAVGKMVISDRLTTLLAEALRSNKPQQAARPDFDSLTPREKDILRLIAEGLSNKMIGRKLDISDGTVKVHVKHLLKKLNLRSRVEVAVWAVEGGLHKG
ncbi:MULTISPECIES: two-component system response regulator NarL [unclassified Marinobacter]|uniref:two-component system response regulator NarL n=1 Tax=unclassified Marinobacter TaxID=83889 RepID=UPI0008DD3780|nr:MULTISPECIES: two-component system response regulator NarL [unclassified Marinobacter]MBQ0833026.1 two-component system response regulator NarL [Marinobacter sp.]OHY81605.1 two-component system response regulator NarL [Marinobacter sp. AC-23]